LPDARTSDADGWSVSAGGRARSRRNALAISAQAMTTAMNTDRKGMPRF
jgi:hypothetical protein